MTGVACPVPILQFFNNAGGFNVNGSILTQVGGVNAATYQDINLTIPLPNPIPLNSRGEVSNASGLTCQLFLTPNVAYTFTFFDGSGNQIDQAAYVNGVQFTLTQASIGQTFYPRTAAEITAGVTPTNYYINSDLLDPRRYGAVGDGVTDDTVAISLWVLVVNATTNPVSTWPVGLTFYCTNQTIAASNFTWNCYSTIKSKPITIFVSQLTFSGSNVTVRGLTLNGNQTAFASSYCSGMLFTANNPTLEDVTITQCSANGLVIDSLTASNTTLTGGTLVNVTIANCAATGYQFNNCAYFNITNFVVKNNGWGFQAAFTQPGHSFGGTTRFRSHHFTFTSCQSMQNGLDGFNTNQGSYAIKYADCLAWMNGDGGYTIAGDNTSTGRPGEGEVCYDLQFIGGESYNNWAGGWVGETVHYNCSIVGGRYYNNGRGVGAVLLTVPSPPNGIYVGTASQGTYISKVQVYDDRQLCPVTASTAGVVTATGWVAGTMGNYPRVAFYSAAMAFQGYGTITAESAGSVTVVTTVNNSVTLASIAAGWFVSQRTQHNGLTYAAQAQGVHEIDGFGQLPGPDVRMGYKAYAAPSSGSNVISKSATTPSIELLSNPSFEVNTTTGWSYAGTGSSAPFNTVGPLLHSQGANALQSTGGTPYVGTGVLITGGSQFCQEGWLEAVCLCNSVGLGASFSVINAAFTTTVNHPGGGTRELRIGFWCPVGSGVTVQIAVTGNAFAIFDELSVKMHFEPSDNRDASYPSRNLPV